MKLAALTRSTEIKVTLPIVIAIFGRRRGPDRWRRCSFAVRWKSAWRQDTTGALKVVVCMVLAPFDCLVIEATRKEEGRQWAIGQS